MDALRAIFPHDDFALLLVIILVPLLGAFVNGVFGKRLGKEAVALMALSAIGVSFIASAAAFLLLKDAERTQEAARLIWRGWDWVTISGRQDLSQVPIQIAFSIDALSGAMALIVTGVGFLIHLYSVKYMEKDPGFHRFFSYLNLFIFSMLVLILGDSLPVLFVGWEGVGLCSYLLIGFWYDNDYNAFAGKKAFVANRIGDFGLLVAMALLVYYCGALDWTGIDAQSRSLLQAKQVWPIGNDVPWVTWLGQHYSSLSGVAEWVNRPRYASAATLVGLALFLGCAGKSAQIPLYVWLPDAMAGPTPVSALIHAATMVTAGVYLVCRMSGVFVLSPAAMFTVATIGGLTAVLAATIALVQNDIKRVLAYSTVSQLGYMFIGVGVGAFAAGFFHVMTHAFFKACLFLGSGSVIHAMHARIHDTDASQDMRNMGGLKRFMPVTFWTFVAAWAAIVAVPFTSGFFSKDEILFQSFTSFVKAPVEGGKLGEGANAIQLFQWPEWGGKFLYTLGVLAAVMTAFYMTRLVIGIFFGEFKGWTIVKRWKAPKHHHGHAHDEHEHGAPLEGPTPHESPWQMTVPLVVLGALSVVGGFLNPHALSMFGVHTHPLDNWLAPVFTEAKKFVEHVPEFEHLVVPLMLPGIGALVVGGGFAYWMYLMQSGEPAKKLAEQMPRLHALVYDKWRIDELYDETILGAVDSLAEGFAWADRWLVDGLLARFTSFVVAAVGTGLRYVQTGRVQAYAAMMIVGVGGMGWFLIAPHAHAQVMTDHASGSYSVTASPGLGYRYRWDADGDGTWDTESFSDKTNVELKLEPDKSQTVRLQVVNAFGRTAEKAFAFSRPKPDRSRGPATTMNVEQGADGQLRAMPQRPRPAASGTFQLPPGGNMDPEATRRLFQRLQQQRGQAPGQPGQPAPPGGGQPAPAPAPQPAPGGQAP